MPETNRAVIATSVMAVAFFVNASVVRAAQTGPKNVGGPAFEQFVESLLTQGSEIKIKGFAMKLGFDKPGITTKADQVVDGQNDRTCAIVYEPDENGQARPVCVLISYGRKEPTKRTSRWYRLSLDGSIEKALTMEGRYDENGKAIPASAVYTDLDLNSKEVTAKLKSELSFWMKRYTKTARASAGGKPGAAKASPSSSK